MFNKRVILPLAFLLGALVIAVLLFATRPENETVDIKKHTISVDVAVVNKQDVSIPVFAQGTVTPHIQTDLVSEVSGKIIEIAPHFSTGGFFKKDELLLKIDDRDYRASLERAKAKLATARSNLAQEQGHADVARKEWLQSGGNKVKRSQASTDLYLRKPQLEQAQAELDAAKADMQKAEDDLVRTSIRAPYDGIIRDKKADIGQFLSASSTIATIFSIDYAEVRLAIPQNKLTYLDLPSINYTPKQPVKVDLYANVGGKQQHWPAVLHRTEETIDEKSRVLRVVARVNDPYGFQAGTDTPLRIGTFVSANITGKTLEDIIVLPHKLLRAGNYLWVVDENDILRNRQVETLQSDGKNVYISSGLEEGEQVSLSLVNRSIVGTRVTINNRSRTGSPSPEPRPKHLEQQPATAQAASPLEEQE